MATAPYGIRLLVGAATVAVEETRKLPQTILTYPMTLVSQAAHMVMLWQQNLAELAIKGDSTLETIFPPKDEQPEWATFDDDLAHPDDDLDDRDGTASGLDGFDRDRGTEGRFALYSSGDETKTTPGTATNNALAGTDVAVPAVATELDYATLTLAQLRARLRSLSTEDLEALLAYEEATTARAPFQTLLSNRINHTTAK